MGTGWQDGKWSSVLCRKKDLEVGLSGKLQQTDGRGGEKTEAPLKQQCQFYRGFGPLAWVGCLAVGSPA